jgi:hypothetical protein
LILLLDFADESVGDSISSSSFSFFSFLIIAKKDGLEKYHGSISVLFHGSWKRFTLR